MHGQKVCSFRFPTTMAPSTPNNSLMAGALLMAQYALAQSAYGGASIPGASQYTAPGGFPTSAFSSYYPVPSGQEPQPALHDPVLNLTYPLNLTNPETIPDYDPDPQYYPSPIANLSTADQQSVITNVISQVGEVITSTSFNSNCSKCLAALSVAKSAAELAPHMVPDAFVEVCKAYKFHSNATCEEDFAADTFGYIWTQILAFADVSGLDGQYICNSLSSTFCPYPALSPLNTSDWFPKPKPANATRPKASGKRVKVAHLSDFHLDPRYKVGAEGNCSSSLCCRANNPNTNLPMGQISLPAAPFGSYECDTPYDLGLAALQAVGPLTGTSKQNPLAWTVYTGDLVSHDPQSELSRAYTEYAEDSIYHMFKEYLTGPVFPVLGNHDTNPEAIDAPHSLLGNLSQQMSWNYNHVSALWNMNGWIDDAAEQEARTHYGAYSIKNHYGLRMITFNSKSRV